MDKERNREGNNLSEVTELANDSALNYSNYSVLLHAPILLIADPFPPFKLELFQGKNCALQILHTFSQDLT